MAGHLSVTPDLIHRISNQNSQPQEVEHTEDYPKQRITHYIYFLQPSFGFGSEGNVFSTLSYGIDRFIREMPKVARAIRAGEKPPTIDIYLLGNPGTFGGEVTQEFVDGVARRGYLQHGRLYAEFVRTHLPQGQDELDKTRIVLQGASKGAITSDKTYQYLDPQVQERTQLLFDNPNGVHDNSVLSRTLRTYNMGVGYALEVLARRHFGLVSRGILSGRREFYEAVGEAEGIQETDQQRKLKYELLLTGDILILAKGTPLDPNQRSFVRISTPDPANTDLGNIAKVVSAPVTERIIQVRDKVLGKEVKPRRSSTVREKGKRLIFATANITHKHAWVRGVKSGGWAQKMNYVENSAPSRSTQPSHSE